MPLPNLPRAYGWRLCQFGRDITDAPDAITAADEVTVYAEDGGPVLVLAALSANAGWIVELPCPSDFTSGERINSLQYVAERFWGDYSHA